MKIALITDSLSIGGAERQVLMAATELQRLGDRVTVIAYHEQIGYDDLVSANQINVEIVGAGVSRPGRVFALADYLRRGKFDVVHGFKGHASYYIRLMSVLAPGPVYFCGYRGLAARGPWYQRLHRLSVARPSGWIVNSEAVGETVARVFGAAVNRIHVVPNGIDLDRWSCPLTPETAKERLGIDPMMPVMTMVAQIRKVKNHPFMLTVLARMKSVGWKGVLLLVGDGSDRPALARQAAALSVDSQVRWLGERKDLPELYRASDVVVLTSDGEGLPNVLIEAAAVGVPSVATDRGGVSEVVVSGESGYLIAVGDDEAMSQRLLELFADEALRRGMGRAARKRVEALFAADVMGRRLRDVYLGESLR